MADLLSVAMFKNIVNKSNFSDKTTAKCSSSVSRLNQSQENMLVGLLNKSQNLSSYVSSASKTSASQATSNLGGNCGKKVSLSEMIKPSNASGSVKSASEVLNSMAKPAVASNPQLGQKVDIQSLIGGVKTPKAAAASYDAKKSTTVTLNELAAKCKKSTDVPVETTVKVETGVKKSVIANALGIDSLVPKISLNSIGKSNSFFK
ncbi:hypothetical protein [Clostridium cylindrosporum]|uniref:Uncharacterized protein n=1 Tax=Clostridium cylindrosporum DSM 605 TaxID=1121307 RepID=A0A0J8G329_CLOCY|nr:hypothetical protein [Clostridium cylindrosporum]KMT22106.1 hypothetical protein CLCY_4c00790 [Clostridium cylindrosporum DSM 605]